MKRRYGYRRIHALLRLEGWKINHKRTHRLFCQAGLQVRRRRRKRIVVSERTPIERARDPNESWSMDFLANSLADGRRLRCLAVVDDFTRECVTTVVDTSISGARVARELDEAIALRGAPVSITVDNGPEFTDRALDGPTAGASGFASSGPASPSRTPMPRASTAACETSA